MSIEYAGTGSTRLLSRSAQAGLMDMSFADQVGCRSSRQNQNSVSVSEAGSGQFGVDE